MTESVDNKKEGGRKQETLNINYFSVMAALLLLVALSGFARTFFLRPLFGLDPLSPQPPCLSQAPGGNRVYSDCGTGTGPYGPGTAFVRFGREGLLLVPGLSAGCVCDVWYAVLTFVSGSLRPLLRASRKTGHSLGNCFSPDFGTRA